MYIGKTNGLMAHSIMPNSISNVIHNSINPPLFLPSAHVEWQEDDSADSCKYCGQIFAGLDLAGAVSIMSSVFTNMTYKNVTKHHCRLCLNVVCKNCLILAKMVVPFTLKRNVPLSQKNDNKYYCKQCYSIIENYIKCERTLRVFTISQFDISNIKTAANKCDIWSMSCNFYISLLRDMQKWTYGFVYDDLSIKIFWTNLRFMYGHNKYICTAFKLCKTEADVVRVINYLETFDGTIVECEYLHCIHSCSNRKGNVNLNTADAFNILAEHFRNKLRIRQLIEYLIGLFDVETEEFTCYLPFLAKNLVNDYDKIIRTLLLEKCSQSLDLSTKLYIELLQLNNHSYNSNNTVYKLVSEELFGIIDEPTQKKIKSCCSFLHIVKGLKHDLDKNQNRMYIDSFSSYYSNNYTYPLNSSVEIKTIDVENIKTINSSNKPSIVPCITTDNQKIMFMIKNEKLSNDKLVMNFIRLLLILLKKEQQLDLEIITYNVMSIDSTSGIIEIVDKSKTIYDIQNNMKLSVLQYMNNFSQYSHEYRIKYANSLAFYQLITYVLDVADRHSDNIMLTEDCQLFHIDYTYILGNCPNITTITGSPGLSINKELVNALCGENSELYKLFIDTATKIFNCIRNNYETFSNLLTHHEHLNILCNGNYSVIDSLLKKKLRPHQNNFTTEKEFADKLANSAASPGVHDFLHYIKQQYISTQNLPAIPFSFPKLW